MAKLGKDVLKSIISNPKLFSAWIPCNCGHLNSCRDSLSESHCEEKNETRNVFLSFLTSFQLCFHYSNWVESHFDKTTDISPEKGSDWRQPVLEHEEPSWDDFFNNSTIYWASVHDWDLMSNFKKLNTDFHRRLHSHNTYSRFSKTCKRILAVWLSKNHCRT